jgi:hypothetical protein
MPINAADVRCPKCQGPVWDERPNKKNPKGPDFKCKDQNCKDDKGYKTGIWERDLAKAQTPAPAANVKQPLPWEQEHAHELLDKMFNVYDACLDHAHEAATRRFGNDVTDTAVAAMAATLYIDARKSGL